MRSRRLVRCSDCGLARALCLCSELPRIATKTRVVVVMHRIELPKTSNTGRLAMGVLNDARLFVRGGRDAPNRAPTGRRLVLYPSAESRPLCPDDARGDEPCTLVVPDGNWAQARRIARRDAWARDAPHVHLPDVAPSRYTLRRDPRAGLLCTFEATAYALSMLEGRDVASQMLPVLDEFMRRVALMRSGVELPATSAPAPCAPS